MHQTWLEILGPQNPRHDCPDNRGFLQLVEGFLIRMAFTLTDPKPPSIDIKAKADNPDTRQAMHYSSKYNMTRGGNCHLNFLRFIFSVHSDCDGRKWMDCEKVPLWLVIT
jgi:hypothetical protein